MTKRPRVAFVSAVFPYPRDNGKKVVLSAYVDFLVREVGAENFFFIKLGEIGRPVSLPFELVELALPSGLRRMLGAFWQSFILRRRSLQESFLYSGRLQRKIEQIISFQKIDIVIMDTLRIAQYFEKPSACRRVFYMEDLFARRYRMILKSIKAGLPTMDPLGAFASNIPRYLHILLNVRLFQMFVLWWEAGLVDKRERQLATRMDAICLVSKREAEIFAVASGIDYVWETAPCLPTPTVRRSPSAACSGIFVILGALDYMPNVAALNRFLEVCMPIIARDMPNARIKIVGRGASVELGEAVARWSQCELLGFVEDLSDLLGSAAAMLVPVEIGGGIKLKTLEALSYGLPLITTANGVEAIPVQNEVHCLIARDLAEFPELMRKIMDQRRNDDLAELAKSFFVSHYSVEAVYPVYRRAFLGLGSLAEE